MQLNELHAITPNSRRAEYKYKKRCEASHHLHGDLPRIVLYISLLLYHLKHLVANLYKVGATRLAGYRSGELLHRH